MEFGFQDTTETMAFISNIPFVKKLIKQNIKLQKKNKELKQLIKLITKNFDLFQHEEKLEIVGKPIKLEKTDLDVTELDDEVLVVEAPQNIKYEVHEIESDDTDVVNTSSYDDYETPIQSCFDTILNSVKTIEDYNKLTIFNQKLWLKNNSLYSLIKTEPEEKVIKGKEEEKDAKAAAAAQAKAAKAAAAEEAKAAKLARNLPANLRRHGLCIPSRLGKKRSQRIFFYTLSQK